MARYAIGDVQGCFDSLMALLKKINFNAKKDELWFAGDLVNRGPKSLDSLRFIKQLGDAGGHPAKVILGNHDLHLLACYHTDRTAKKKDTFSDILNAQDCDELMSWLIQQPLMHWDKASNFVMIHAGIPHIWSIEKAYRLNQEVYQALQQPNLREFFKNMYGNEPRAWSDGLSGLTRLRVITNYFTRMRFIKANGELDFAAKEDLDSGPEGFLPWFSLPPKNDTRFIFGHWAALAGKTGYGNQFQAIDTGCVWGAQLTAFNLDTLERHHCESKEVPTS
ncbi:MAG: bis(5'-nucleosyl)-tetraphosphatase (symmetrical) [Oleiphilaceae bacterium]|jgi:bis(5'-nucleosyl)-tetraphosphatase (symmetrical)